MVFECERVWYILLPSDYVLQQTFEWKKENWHFEIQQILLERERERESDYISYV